MIIHMVVVTTIFISLLLYCQIFLLVDTHACKTPMYKAYKNAPDQSKEMDEEVQGQPAADGLMAVCTARQDGSGDMECQDVEMEDTDSKDMLPPNSVTKSDSSPVMQASTGNSFTRELGCSDCQEPMEVTSEEIIVIKETDFEPREVHQIEKQKVEDIVTEEAIKSECGDSLSSPALDMLDGAQDNKLPQAEVGSSEEKPKSDSLNENPIFQEASKSEAMLENGANQAFDHTSGSRQNLAPVDKQCLLIVEEVGVAVAKELLVGDQEPIADAEDALDVEERLSQLKKTDSNAMRTLDKVDIQPSVLPFTREEEVQREEPSFPNTLEEFGFKFNENGELRSINDGQPFNFCEKVDNYYYNQKRYEALGEIITNYVYDLLEKEGLERVYIPIDAVDDEARGFFFMSPNALKKEALLVLIHGSGVVRAGQWTRKLIINNDLSKGTQIDYIRFGLAQGYGVIVLNTNLNYVTKNVNGREERNVIQCSRYPEQHGIYVWKEFIAKATDVKHISIVAHSYGGIVTCALVNDNDVGHDVQERVFAMAFTDSVHSMQYGVKKTTQTFFKSHGRNWISSDLELDARMPYQSQVNDALRVSAGHEKHEWTSHAAKESVFKYIMEKYNKRLKPDDCAGRQLEPLGPDNSAEKQRELISPNDSAEKSLESISPNDIVEKPLESIDLADSVEKPLGSVSPADSAEKPLEPIGSNDITEKQLEPIDPADNSHITCSNL